MNYVSLRLLGLGPDVPIMQEIRTWIHEHGETPSHLSISAADNRSCKGGAVCVPSWAKAWLSILGAYEWEGVSPIPPELW